MALPPEHLHIKRRREEDPVETLYIQSDSVQHSKRRFTDFVFQRVVRERDKTVVAARTHGDDVGNAAAEQSLASVPPATAAPTAGGQRAVSAGIPAAAGRPPVASVAADGGGGGGGIPTVRTTVPGEEFARGKRAVRPREGDEVTRKTELGAGSAASGAGKVKEKNQKGPVASPKAMAGMRRFHLAAPAGGEGLTSASVGQGSRLSRKGLGGGGGRGGRVQKRRTGKPSARAVVVEKAQVPAVGGGEGTAAAGPKERVATAAAALEDVTSMIGSVKVSGGGAAKTVVDLDAAEMVPSSGAAASPPRKRHVVNEAERRWRDEEKASKYADRMLHDRDEANRVKTGRSAADDPSTWNQDSEQLADELSRIAMQMTGDESEATVSAAAASSPPKPPPTRPASSSPSKSPLKYPPRLPKQLRARRPSRGGSRGGMRFDGGSDEMDDDEAMDVDPTPPQKAAPTDVADVPADTDDSDSGYIYDEFIRRPVANILEDPRLAQLYGNHDLLGLGEDVKALPRDIGVVVITNEDAHYWDAFAEDDEEDSGWDTEDEDSNAEDNPANEYPDEDLDFDDEFDDTNAAYKLYRQNASDDEEFDVYEYEDHHYAISNGGDSDDMGGSV